MPEISRRNFIGGAAAVTGAAAMAAALPAADALAATGQHAPPRTPRLCGDLRDVKHIVVLMQENRSFDHYLGCLKGVRGFADRSTITLPGGLSVFQQPVTAPGSPVTATQYPWRLSDARASEYPLGHQPPTSETGAQGYGGTSHSWDDQHAAWYGGLMNGWVFAKGGPTTLGYLNRQDIPFHYALADTYTVGDAYHSSVLSATGPNRTYLWSGTIDAQQKFSSYTAYNGGDELGRNLLWTTYAETLQKAGVSWNIYQCADNYGDNAAAYFKTFAQYDPTQGGTAAPGNAFYDHGVAGVPEPLTGLTANADNLANAIRADVVAGKLPQVSWVVTNQAFSEHPDGAPNDGAYYIHEVLKALNADPEVFNSTVVIIDYDENDGQFDHVPPPVPAPGEKDEFYLESSGTLAQYGLTNPMPVGLGFRVPLFLVSPWTRGGHVTSEVSDHTSVIQFMEKWTEAIGRPARSTNISQWRRRVCGDLTSAFDFRSPVFGLPTLPTTTVIGDPAGGSYHPPVTSNAMPAQEPGHKPARPLPYQPNANLISFAVVDEGDVEARLSFSNNGPHVHRASHFAVYDNLAPTPTLAEYPAKFPGQYTVDGSSSSLAKSVNGAVGIGTGTYDLTITGPNRFLRNFAGDTRACGRDAQVEAVYEDHGFGRHPKLLLRLNNEGSTTLTFTVTAGNYSADRPKTYHLRPHSTAVHSVNPLQGGGGWYDLTVRLAQDATWSRRYVGHLENGNSSVTG
jgi:phospholipase C